MTFHLEPDPIKDVPFIDREVRLQQGPVNRGRLLAANRGRGRPVGRGWAHALLDPFEPVLDRLRLEAPGEMPGIQVDGQFRAPQLDRAIRHQASNVATGQVRQEVSGKAQDTPRGARFNPQFRACQSGLEIRHHPLVAAGFINHRNVRVGPSEPGVRALRATATPARKIRMGVMTKVIG